MDGCNWNVENRDDCKSLFQRNTVPLKMQDHCKRSPEIMIVPLKYMASRALLKLQYTLKGNICQIHCIHVIHVCKCSSKINTVSKKERMAAATSVKERNTVLWKKLFPAINAVNYKGKCFLGTSVSDHIPFLWAPLH